MENGFVWLQNGEYERSHTRDEKLRNNDKDVLYTLQRARAKKSMRASYPFKKKTRDKDDEPR